MRPTVKTIRPRLLPLAVACLALLGCADKFPSYGVILWSADDKIVQTASIVGVSARSQLRKTLQIRLLDAKGEAVGDPVSIPNWRVKEFPNHAAAERWLKDNQSIARMFGHSTKLALPVRRDPAISQNNIVYRLRDQETVKILDKQEKESVQGNLKGYWYHVLTSTGTDGWVFSVQLDLYEPGVNKPAALASQDSQVDALVHGNWRPEEFQAMIDAKQYDLDVMAPSHGFFVDDAAKTLRISTDKDELSFNYKSLDKIDRDDYQATGTSVQIAFRDEKSIIVQYQKDGSVFSKVFVKLDQDVQALYDAELERRAELLAKIGGHGGAIKSDNYGSIQFGKDFSFQWTGADGLPKTVVPASAGNQGSVSFNVALSDELRATYQGVITFNFRGSPGNPVDFLYQTRADGVQLEFLPRSLIKGNLAKRADSSPTVLFFAR